MRARGTGHAGMVWHAPQPFWADHGAAFVRRSPWRRRRGTGGAGAGTAGRRRAAVRRRATARATRRGPRRLWCWRRAGGEERVRRPFAAFGANVETRSAATAVCHAEQHAAVARRRRASAHTPRILARALGGERDAVDSPRVGVDLAVEVGDPEAVDDVGRGHVEDERLSDWEVQIVDRLDPECRRR